MICFSDGSIGCEAIDRSITYARYLATEKKTEIETESETETIQSE